MAAALVHLRRGMTLVELLVVVAILGLLSVVVLPNLSNSGDARKAREAARSVSSFVASMQSRAIGTRGGGGLWIEPLPNVITDTNGVAHVVAIDLFAAQIPDPYAGEATNSAVTVVPNPPMSAAALGFQNGFALPQTLLNSSNTMIRFAGAPALFRLSQLQMNASGSATGTATMNLSRNQTPFNTAWPVVTTSTGVSYEILLAAVKDPSSSLTLGYGMAIDLTWTYLKSTSAWPPGSVISTSTASQVLYDSTGSPSDVVCAGGLSEPMLEPVCFLVAPLEMIQDATCFRKPGAYWVAIDPRGGVPRVAEVNPIGSQYPQQNTADLRTSQFNVRESTFQEGR